MLIPESPGASGAVPSPRRLNRQRLLDAIRRHGPISRADLAKRLCLSPPTVSGLVDELVNQCGLLRETGTAASSGGRPPVLLEFNADVGTLVGVDIGSRTVRFALADLQGRVLAREEERTRVESCAATVDQVCAGIERISVAAGRDRSKLFAIGIGAPGMTDVTSGRVVSAANLVDWVDVPLRQMVEERLGRPVRVENDANLAAQGERWKGVAQSVDQFVFLALGAGVGAGIVIDGRLHRGHHSYAGEVSRMTLDYRDWHLDFGERGYLESCISAAAIPEWDQARPLVERAGADREGVMRTIFEAAALGEPQAMAVVEKLAVYLGAAVANIVSVLDPALIVFGGGLSHAGQVLLAPVRDVVSRIVPNVPTLATSALGDDAPLLGAVYAALELADERVAAMASAPCRG